MDTFIPYSPPKRSLAEAKSRAKELHAFMEGRRTVRKFSDQPVPREVIEHIILTASTAPSGAHKQPWTFCAISDPALKQEIRIGAEAEEKRNYESRMSESWKEDLKPFGTNEHKPFLEIAPWLIVVFKKAYDLKDGEKFNNYYVNESVGLASGFLLQAIYNAGLVSLTHTPSPMKFLTKILGRPENERPFLLIPVGFPAEGTSVPNLQRKPLEEVSAFYEEE
ncbi:MAG: nitroreductase family protein [Bacteroidota bacterium]